VSECQENKIRTTLRWRDLAIRSGIRILVVSRDFFFSKTSIPTLGSTQHPIEWSSRFFPEIKRSGREVNHSPLSSAEFKNEWSYTSTPPVYLYGIDRKSLPLNSRENS
jgi:hypothetical protein